jgi:hypothetical protein
MAAIIGELSFLGEEWSSSTIMCMFVGIQVNLNGNCFFQDASDLGHNVDNIINHCLFIQKLSALRQIHCKISPEIFL